MTMTCLKLQNIFNFSMKKTNISLWFNPCVCWAITMCIIKDQIYLTTNPAHSFSSSVINFWQNIDTNKKVLTLDLGFGTTYLSSGIFTTIFFCFSPLVFGKVWAWPCAGDPLRLCDSRDSWRSRILCGDDWGRWGTSFGLSGITGDCLHSEARDLARVGVFGGVCTTDVGVASPERENTGSQHLCTESAGCLGRTWGLIQTIPIGPPSQYSLCVVGGGALSKRSGKKKSKKYISWTYFRHI